MSQARAAWLPEHAPGIALCLVLAGASYFLATLPGLKVLGPLTVALIVGIAFRAALGIPDACGAGAKVSGKGLLRLGIVLMGARLDFGTVAKVGPKVLLLDVAIIAVGIAGTTWIARRFGVPDKLATLLAVGGAICGASASIAAGTVIKAEEKDVTLAVGLCGILGTIGVLFYVLVGPALALSTGQLAVLSGSTLHEVAQVMAAAFTWGNAAGDLGTLVKLTRVVLLAPSLVVLGVVAGGKGAIRYSWKEPPIPWFVIGFLAVGAVCSTGLVPAAVKGGLSTASVFLMVTSMAALGLFTNLEMFRKAGMKVVYAGLAGFGMLTLLSWTLIHALDIR